MVGIILRPLVKKVYIISEFAELLVTKIMMRAALKLAMISRRLCDIIQLNPPPAVAVALR